MTDSDKFWDDSRIRLLTASRSCELSELVKIIGFEPKSFFRHADFRGIDLRNQDMSEMDISLASFEGAIVDSTTILNKGKRPISNKSQLYEEVISAIEAAEPFFDKIKLFSDIKDVLGRSVGCCFFVDEFLNIVPIIEEVVGGLIPAVFPTKRGYIERNVLIAPIARPRRGLETALHGILRSRFPYLRGARGAPASRQLRLPLPDIRSNISAEARPKATFRPILRQLRIEEGVTDIWLVVEQVLPRVVQKEMASLWRDNGRIHFMISATTIGEARDYFRTVNMPGRSAVVIEADKYRTKGLNGFLTKIEHSLGFSIKFTPAFRRHISDYKTWERAKSLVTHATSLALRRASTTPITVGLRDLRSAVPTAKAL